MIRLSLALSKSVRIVVSQKTLSGLVCNVEYKDISASSEIANGRSTQMAILDEVGQVRGPTGSFVETVEKA